MGQKMFCAVTISRPFSWSLVGLILISVRKVKTTNKNINVVMFEGATNCCICTLLHLSFKSIYIFLMYFKIYSLFLLPCEKTRLIKP